MDKNQYYLKIAVIEQEIFKLEKTFKITSKVRCLFSGIRNLLWKVRILIHNGDCEDVSVKQNVSIDQDIYEVMQVLSSEQKEEVSKYKKILEGDAYSFISEGEEKKELILNNVLSFALSLLHKYKERRDYELT